MADGFSAALANNLSGAFGGGVTPYMNPQFMTKEQLASRRAYADALLKPMQVHRPTEGIANIVRALVGGNMAYQADQSDQSMIRSAGDAASKFYNGAIGDGAGGAAPAPTSMSGGLPSGARAYAGDSASPAAPGFDFSVNRTLGFEGGLNARDTNGTPSNYGINQAAHPNIDVTKITPDQAKAIYKHEYWDGIGADKMPPALAHVAFDTAVISGPEKARELVEASGGDPNKLMALRENYQNGLIQQNPGKYGKYAQAWSTRNAGLRSDVASLSGNAGGAIDAVAPGAPSAGGALPPGAMAFNGSQPTSGAPPVGIQPPAQASAGGMSAQDYGRIVANPNIPESVKAAATGLITPKYIETPGGGHIRETPMAGTTPATVNPGLLPSTAGVGGQSLPQASTVDPRTGRLVTQPMMPGGAGGGGGAPANPNDPIAPYRPYIKAGQDVAADATAKGQTAAASGADLGRDRTAAMNYNRTVFPLEHAIPALERLGTTGTGPGTEQFNEIKSFLQSAGIPGLDVSKIKDFDEAKKYLTDFVNQSGGGGTNDKLAAAFAGNPNVHISNAAAVDVAKSALALQRMQQAKVLAFGRSGRAESDYQNFATNFSTFTDPRAFGFDMMSPEARAKLLQTLPAGSAERSQFISSLRMAHDLGLVRPPGQ